MGKLNLNKAEIDEFKRLRSEFSSLFNAMKAIQTTDDYEHLYTKFFTKRLKEHTRLHFIQLWNGNLEVNGHGRI